MTGSLSPHFGNAAAPDETKVKRKRPAPLSLRLNDRELRALRQAAAGRSMNGYIRERLFGELSPSAMAVRDDHAALARVLGQLGRSDLFTSLAAIALAAERGRLSMDAETLSTLHDACDAITAMRGDLVIALGLRKA